jgi:hypothetical protein
MGTALHFLRKIIMFSVKRIFNMENICEFLNRLPLITDIPI